jgi:hypothetical protein
MSALYNRRMWKIMSVEIQVPMQPVRETAGILWNLLARRDFEDNHLGSMTAIACTLHRMNVTAKINHEKKGV